MTPLLTANSGRAINIPSEDECKNLCNLFGIPSGYEGIQKFNVLREKVRVTPGKAKIESFDDACWMYASTRMPLEDLMYIRDKYKGTDEGGLVSLTGYSEKSVSFVTQLTDNIFSHHSDDGEEEFKNEEERVTHELGVFTIGVFLQRIDSKIVKNSQISDEVYTPYLSSLLLYPPFLLDQKPGFQKHFFHDFFTNLHTSDQKSAAQNPKSLLWQYLDTYYGEIEALSIHRPTNKRTAFIPREVGDLVSRLIGGVKTDQSIPDKDILLELLISSQGVERIQDSIKFQRALKEYGNVEAEGNSPYSLVNEEFRRVTLSFLSGSLDNQILDSDLRISFCSFEFIAHKLDEILLSHSGNKKNKDQEDALGAILASLEFNSDGFLREFTHLTIAILIIKFNNGAVRNTGILDSKEAGNILISPLLYPGYLQNTSSEEQIKFFKLFFRHHTNEHLRESEGLCEYLLNNFGSVSIVTDKLESLAREGIEEVKLSEREIRDVETILGVIDLEDRKKGITGALINLRDNRKSTPTQSSSGIKTSEIISNYLSGKVNPVSFDGSYELTGVGGEIRDQTIGNAILMTTQFTTKDQDFFIERAGDFSRGAKLSDNSTTNELQAMEYAVLLMKFSRPVLEAHIGNLGFFSKISRAALLDKKYLSIAPEFEQDNFFYMWFEAEKANPELLDKESAIWKYLNRHFGKIPRVKSEYRDLGRIEPGSQGTSGTDTAINVEDVEQIDVPQIDASNTRIIREGDQYTLTTDVELSEGIFLHVGVGRKSKGWVKDISFTAYSSIGEMSVCPGEGEVIVVGCFASPKINAGIYRNNLSHFPKIAIPRPVLTPPARPIVSTGGNKRVKSAASPAKPGSELIVSDTQASGNEAKVETNTPLPDYFILELLIDDQEPTSESIRGNTVTFTYKINPDDIEENHLSSTLLTNTVIISIEADPKIVSFFGVSEKNYKPDDATFVKLKERVSIIHIEKEERREKERKEFATKNKILAIEATEKNIATQGGFNPKIEEAYNFMLACTISELRTKGEQGHTTYHWRHAPKGPMLVGLNNEATRFGFQLELSGKSAGYNDTLRLKNTEAQFSFNLNSYPIQIDYQEEKAEQSILAHEVACRIVAYIFHERFKTKRGEYERIMKGVRKGMDVETATRQRILGERAELIDPKTWQVIKSGVSMKNSEIHDGNILGISGLIRVGGLLSMSERFSDKTPKCEIYKSFAREMFQSGNEHLIELFYKRILVTLGLTPARETTGFSNLKAEKLVKSDFQEICLDASHEDKVATCSEVLRRFYGLNLPVEIVQPKVFTLAELGLIVEEKERKKKDVLD